MERSEKLLNLLSVRKAIRNIVEKETGQDIDEERLNDLMKDLAKSYLK